MVPSVGLTILDELFDKFFTAVDIPVDARTEKLVEAMPVDVSIVAQVALAVICVRVVDQVDEERGVYLLQERSQGNSLQLSPQLIFCKPQRLANLVDALEDPERGAPAVVFVWNDRHGHEPHERALVRGFDLLQSVGVEDIQEHLDVFHQILDLYSCGD